MSRPLKIESANVLKEMTDGELDYICYELRKKYAAGLNAGTFTEGVLNVGSVSGYTSIGTAANTRNDISTASAARTNNTGDDVDPDGAGPTAAGDWPASPALTTSTVTTYNYYQDRRQNTYPSTAALNSDSYLIFKTGALRVAGSAEAELYDQIVSQTITDMKTGDEVGTYRVSTSTPNSGGAGTWVDKGTFFQDTTFSDGTTTSKYWLKTALTTEPGETAEICRWTGSAIQEMGTSQLTSLLDNVLVPVLRRRINAGNLNYAVQGTSGSNNRGSFVDKRQNSSTQSYAFTDPTYYTYSTPASGTTDINTYYLNITG